VARETQERNETRPAADVAGARALAKSGGRTALGFWTKLNEDWMFNFSGMLAYNYLTATAPLALVILALAGLALGAISPATLNAYVNGLTAHLPAGGADLLSGALRSLNKSAGVLLVIAIVTALYAGSRLFIALENCFSVIYRLDVRPFLPQNVVAIGMTILYAVLAPLVFLVSSEIANLFNFLNMVSAPVVTYIIGLLVAIFSAFMLFLAMYLIIPNRRQPWRHALRVSWRGALVAAVLLTLYQQLFPIYRSLFLRNAGYSSVAGLAIIAIVFLYYVGFISLLGAEINAWREGLRPLNATLPDLFQQRQNATAR
jgi:YihY family inner membrane protein